MVIIPRVNQLKKITGNEDFSTPIILLFMFSMMLSLELRDLLHNLQGQASIMISEPAIFTDNIFETIARISWFTLPLIIAVAAIKEQHTFLKVTYFIGIWPLILTKPVIEKIGYKSLYALKAALIFITVLCLIGYLNKITILYKKAIKEDV
jgi:hypothetical protein